MHMHIDSMAWREADARRSLVGGAGGGLVDVVVGREKARDGAREDEKAGGL